MFVIRYLLCGLARFIFWLRYRLDIQGLEEIRDLKSSTLILPNHPAYVDPMLVLALLWPKLYPRPLLAEEMFVGSVFYPIMWLVNGVRLPPLERASIKARQRAEKVIHEVIDGLRRGENYIMWPSGRTQRRGKEVLGGARALAQIIKEVPEANFVRLRSSGLWGSRFSRAYTGTGPRLVKQMLICAGWLLANLLFFMPRRRVTITIERVDVAPLQELDRMEINQRFEDWYNTDDTQKPKFVPYHPFLGPRQRDFPPTSGPGDVDVDKIEPETREGVARILAEHLHRPLTESENRVDVTLDELGMDSLDRMDVTLELERHFGFSGDEVPQTVGQLWELAQGLAKKTPPKPPPKIWFQPAQAPKKGSGVFCRNGPKGAAHKRLPTPFSGRVEIVGENLLEAFVGRALAHPKDAIVADDLSGVLTYEKVLTGALVMARRFKEIPGRNVGVLLPASAAADIVFFALHFAGKLPVMLNFTTGPANLKHAANLMELTHVVTSNRFLDRIHLEVNIAENICLEDMRKKIGVWEKLFTLLKVRWRHSWVRRQMPTISPDDRAVVLFTSGSEKEPKAVPLTHHNILSNQQASIQVLELTRQDSVLGFLPPFHSFGLSITALLPMLSGIRVVKHPDPTDAGGLVRKAAVYKTSIVLTTPTFLGYMLDRAGDTDFQSLRLLIVGAEKCPAELFERYKQKAPNALLVEGYGITECSPIVTANRPEAYKPGTIGLPLSNVELRVVDVDTGEPVPAGEKGMLLVSGPSVFSGYITGDEKTAEEMRNATFREEDGKRWYITGDLVTRDEDGFVTFKGRLKRTLKAGAEMISLAALEEPFARLYPKSDEEGPRVAVEGIQLDSRCHIVLFTTEEELTLREANTILKDAGFHGILRLDEVRHVDSIPVLGIGKTDYKVLRRELEKEQEVCRSTHSTTRC